MVGDGIRFGTVGSISELVWVCVVGVGIKRVVGGSFRLVGIGILFAVGGNGGVVVGELEFGEG